MESTSSLTRTSTRPRFFRHRAKLARRAGWTLGDQVLSSVTNFVLSIVVARSVSARDFGAFAIAYTLSFLFLQLSRAIGSEPLLIRNSASPYDEWRRATASATGVALVLGAVASSATLAAGLSIGGPLGSALVALALVLPPILLQDMWRYAFFALGRPARAAANDAVWAVVQLGAFFVVFALPGPQTAADFIVAWGAAAAAGALFGLLQTRIVPQPRSTVSWLRTHRDLAPRYVAEFLVFRGSVLVSLYGLGVIAGLAAVGALRAAQTLFGPLNVLFLGVAIAAIPEGVRASADSVTRLVRAVRMISVVLAAVAVVCGVAMLALPSSVGASLLGRSWPGAQSLLLPTAILMVTVGAMTGPWIGLRSLGAARSSLRAGIVIALLNVSAGLAGALAAGAYGTATGLAAAGCVATYVWWRQFAIVGRMVA